MNIGRTSNPAFGKNAFSNVVAGSGSGVMTVQGTVNKIFVMLLLVVAAASYTWKMVIDGNITGMYTFMAIGGIGGFIVAMISIFKKTATPYTAPVYAVLEGLFIGGISALLNSKYPGIALNAVTLTFGTLFAMLFAYKTGLIKVTQKFRTGIIAATGGIAIAYFLSFIFRLFGMEVGFIYGNGNLSIVISLVVVIIAALNLVLDFDFIENGARAGAPKYMEWYGAFGLMVTLIWLYIEILRLLAKISSRD